VSNFNRDLGLYNPSTSDVEYTDEEAEFLRALNQYKQLNHRPCPTYREVLAVAVSLGYRRVASATTPPRFRMTQEQRRLEYQKYTEERTEAERQRNGKEVDYHLKPGEVREV
jgi:hypothetical protein